MKVGVGKTRCMEDPTWEPGVRKAQLHFPANNSSAHPLPSRLHVPWPELAWDIGNQLPTHGTWRTHSWWEVDKKKKFKKLTYNIHISVHIETEREREREIIKS